MPKPVEITLTIHADDAEAFLREHAVCAAHFSAMLDYISRRAYWSVGRSGESYDDARRRWAIAFLKSKRIVQAFGVEFEPTSEQETVTIDYAFLPGKNAKLDYSNPIPAWRKGIHPEACKAAADRVVRRWRAMIEERAAA